MYFSSRWIVCDQAIGDNIPFAQDHFKVLWRLKKYILVQILSYLLLSMINFSVAQFSHL